jgi:hypothetical protein
MINVPKNKMNRISAPSQRDADREKMLTRRALFKWSLIGGLLAFPVGLTVYRKLNDGSYQYLLKGPFKFIDGIGSLQEIDKSRWSGNTSGKIYVPDEAWVSKSVFSKIGASFIVSDAAPQELRANVTMSAISNKKEIISKQGTWGVPQKELPRDEDGTIYLPDKKKSIMAEDDIYKNMMALPIVNMSLKLPQSVNLSSVDEIVFVIREI